MVLLIFNGGKRLLMKTFYLYNYFDLLFSMVLKPEEKLVFFFLFNSYVNRENKYANDLDFTPQLHITVEN